MDSGEHRTPALLLALAVGGLALFLVLVSAAPTAAEPEAWDRDLEPVVVTGSAVDAFSAAPVDDLFVYAYSGGTWTQIPFQVDEVQATGVYTPAFEDGLLDANDEIVFMAMDLGSKAPPTPPISHTLPISDTWYEIQVGDPLNPGQRGWATVVRSSSLTPIFPEDYVDFDADLHRIDAAQYDLRLGTSFTGFEYLALGGSGVDILDRTKIRAYSSIFPLPKTEDDLPLQPDGLVRDGPVRVIVRGGRGLAYGSLLSWVIRIPQAIPFYTAGYRFSTDFSLNAFGATHYDAVVPLGVMVDGLNDSVAPTPLSTWFQLSTSYGTLIQVGDTGDAGGYQTNYYRDNLALDPQDTGDQRSYGDTGTYVQDPNLTFDFPFNIYFLDGSRPNLGDTYADYFLQPLSVKSHRQPATLVYLPVIRRGATR